MSRKEQFELEFDCQYKLRVYKMNSETLRSILHKQRQGSHQSENCFSTEMTAQLFTYISLFGSLKIWPPIISLIPDPTDCTYCLRSLSIQLDLNIGYKMYISFQQSLFLRVDVKFIQYSSSQFRHLNSTGSPSTILHESPQSMFPDISNWYLLTVFDECFDLIQF